MFDGAALCLAQLAAAIGGAIVKFWIVHCADKPDGIEDKFLQIKWQCNAIHSAEYPGNGNQAINLRWSQDNDYRVPVHRRRI